MHQIMIQPPGLFQRFFELHLVSEALTFKAGRPGFSWRAWDAAWVAGGCPGIHSMRSWAYARSFAPNLGTGLRSRSPTRPPSPHTMQLMALVPPSPRHQDTVLKHFTRLTSLFGTLPSARTPK